MKCKPPNQYYTSPAVHFIAGTDSNLRPPGYEPDELLCSTPHRQGRDYKISRINVKRQQVSKAMLTHGYES